MRKILSLLDKYKGLILLVLTILVMLNMYVARIEQLNQIEENQVSVVESE